MMKRLTLTFPVPIGVLYLLGCVSAADGSGVTKTEDFEFVSGGNTLSGFIDRPPDREATALIVFVHGSGSTDVRRGNTYVDLRRRFAELGISSVTWDKPGFGRSQGEYDDGQLAESAQEVLDAVAFLRARNVPGSTNIGIWSVSRGTSVAPLAMSRDPSIRFWISVSGVPPEDNKYYLMKSNLPLEGRTRDETDQLMEEWKLGRQLFMNGADYDVYLAATENLRSDPVVVELAGDLTGTREEYEAEQAAFLQTREQYAFDEETTSLIRIRNFDEILGALSVDVLALFGEKDTNVDWSRTRALYQSTIGRNPNATLTVHTFPSCNHSMNVSATGSVREVEGMPLDVGHKCPGYYETQLDWLRSYVVPD